MEEDDRDMFLGLGGVGVAVGVAILTVVAIIQRGWADGLTFLGWVSLLGGGSLILAGGVAAVRRASRTPPQATAPELGVAPAPPVQKDAFMRGLAVALEQDMRTPPDADTSDFGDMVKYAACCPGQMYATVVLGIEDWWDYIELLRRRWNSFERDWMSFVDLRMLLYDRHQQYLEWEVTAEDELPEREVRVFRDLYDAACSAWEREAPRREELGA